MVGLWLVYTVGQCDIFGEIARGETGIFADFLEKLKNGLLLVVKDGGFLLPTRPPLLRRAGRVGLCFLVICKTDDTSPPYSRESCNK